MTTNQVSKGSGNGLHFWVALLLALLLLGLWMMGYGPGGSKCKPAAVEAIAPAVVAPAVTAPAVVAPPVAATPAPAAPAAVAAVASPVPAAKVYFGLDKIDLPKDVNKTLDEVVTYLKSNSDAKAKISGFHDPTGNKAHNEDLAKGRAKAVRGALVAAGIAEDRTTMEKPAETTGTGDMKEARRVEVSVYK
jgi:outer membrane protein OmpA-like peptidoglycan-associated protein